MTIVAGSMFLSSAWLKAIPIFQEPDENAHANYAFTMYTSERLLRAAEGTPAIDSHPYVRYLENVTKYRRMRYNPEGRVPPGYGSKDYYAEIDRNAPIVPRDLVGRTRQVPDVLPSYAYFYYGLVALAMSVGSELHGGSLTAAFFFGRGLSIVLLACSLVLSYLIFREFGIPVLQRLAMLAIVAYLPLTIWVSAYIQPDNFAFTAVTLTLYFALRSRDSSGALPISLGLGVALALLWMSKVQYFVAVAVPVIASFVATIAHRRSGARWIPSLACIAVPVVAAVISTEAITRASTAERTYVTAFGDFLARAESEGPRTLLTYALHETLTGYGQTFFWGRGLFTYWSGFGYIPTAIFAAPADAVYLLWLTISALTILVGALLVVRTAQISRRLLAVGQRRSWPTAIRLFLSNVVLNSYVLFAAILIAVFVDSAGRLGQFGRYWLPFQPAAVMCATYFAPQAFTRKWRKAFSTVMVIGLLAYAGASSYAGLRAVRDRYYLPSPTSSSSEGMAFIDELAGRSIRAIPGTTPSEPSFPQESTVDVRGWAIDSRAGLPAQGVDLVVDGTLRVPARYGLPTCNRLVDVPFFDSALDNCGFETRLALSRLALGPHVLSLEVYEANRTQPYPSRANVAFLVTR